MIYNTNVNVLLLFFFSSVAGLVRVSKTSHSAHDTKHVVVRGKHGHVGLVGSVKSGDSGSVINSGEVASSGRLVELGLEGETVRIDTGDGATGVVVVGLDGVEVLTLLGRETILAVKLKLEAGKRSVGLFGEVALGGGSTGSVVTETDNTGRLVGLRVGVGESNVGEKGLVVGHVPKVGDGRSISSFEAPDELLDGVVVVQTNVLGSRGGGSLGTGELNLFNKVFVRLLGEQTTFLGIKVDVVGPALNGGSVNSGSNFGRPGEVESDFVVLKSNKRKSESGVSVEEEDERNVDGGVGSTSGVGVVDHLGVLILTGLIVVQLGKQSPPALVVLVDALTTDGEFAIGNHTLGGVDVGGSSGGGTRGGGFEEHLLDKITVTRDGNGGTSAGSGGSVDNLLNAFHGKVGVTLVNGFEESDLRVTRKIDILGPVGY